MYSERFLPRALRHGRKKLALSLSHLGDFRKHVKNPVFIIGCGRSGTSILTKSLRVHKEICEFSEANEIWDPKGYPWNKSNLNRPPIWSDPNEYIEKWREYFDESYKRKLKNVFGTFQYISRKKVFLNKSPMNTFRIPDIQDIFPDCKFIHMIRDGRAVTRSWTKKQFRAIEDNEEIFRNRGYYYDFDGLLKLISNSWREHIKEVFRQKEKLGLEKAGKLIELRYEDLVENPESTMNEIYDFIGLNKSNTKLSDYSYFENMNYKWKEDLSNDQKKLVNNEIKDTLAELEYISD